MIGPRMATGLCALAALVVSAVSAPGAAAIPTGTTLFTCKETGLGGDFTKPHCSAADKGAGLYSHVPIAENTTMDFEGVNNNPEISWKIKSTVAGVELELQARQAQIVGLITNMKDASTGEHTANGNVYLVLRDVTVTKPNDPNCLVRKDELATKKPSTNEMIESRLFRITTAGQGDAMKFEPNMGSILASFFIEGCAKAALNKTYDLTGSFVTASLDGAAMTFTHTSITAQNTLKLAGEKAGIDGPLTLEARDPTIETDLYSPASFTTIPT